MELPTIVGNLPGILHGTLTAPTEAYGTSRFSYVLHMATVQYLQLETHTRFLGWVGIIFGCINSVGVKRYKDIHEGRKGAVTTKSFLLCEYSFPIAQLFNIPLFQHNASEMPVCLPPCGSQSAEPLKTKLILFLFFIPFCLCSLKLQRIFASAHHPFFHWNHLDASDSLGKQCFPDCDF